MSSSPAAYAVGLVEVHSCTATLVTADVMCKAGSVRLAGLEQDTSQGFGIKVIGDAGSVRAAVEDGVEIAQKMHCYLAHHVWPRFAPEADVVVHCAQEYNALMSSFEHLLPGYAGRPAFETAKGTPATMSTEDAIGMIETQGFVGVLEGADAMCKAGDVTIIGKEKLGGGYITVLVRGQVAAVRSAVEAGQAAIHRVGGKLVLAHVIPRPHAEILSLLPGGK